MPTPASSSQIDDLIHSNLTDPLNGQNTAALAREVLLTMNASYANKLDGDETAGQQSDYAQVIAELNKRLDKTSAAPQQVAGPVSFAGGVGFPTVPALLNTDAKLAGVVQSLLNGNAGFAAALLAAPAAGGARVVASPALLALAAARPQRLVLLLPAAQVLQAGAYGIKADSSTDNAAGLQALRQALLAHA